MKSEDLDTIADALRGCADGVGNLRRRMDAVRADVKIAAYGKALTKSQQNSLWGSGGKRVQSTSPDRDVGVMEREMEALTREGQSKKLSNGAYPKDILNKINKLRYEIDLAIQHKSQNR